MPPSCGTWHFEAPFSAPTVAVLEEDPTRVRAEGGYKRLLGCIPVGHADLSQVAPAVFGAVELSAHAPGLVAPAEAQAIVRTMRRAGLVNSAGHVNTLAGVDGVLLATRVGTGGALSIARHPRRG